MRIAPIALTACALACAVGCRTTKDVLDDYERNMTAGNYAALPGEPAELAAKGDDSSLLWHLLAGGGFYLADAKADALRLISFLTGEERSVIEGYYILAKSWQQLSYDLYMSERRVYMLRKSALTKLLNRYGGDIPTREKTGTAPGK